MRHPKKIAIVDDDKEFLEELEEMLRQADYDVTTSSDSSLAVEMVNQAKPDLILLDLRMQPLSGFEVAQRLKRFPETSGIPIVAMSAYYSAKEHEFLMNVCDIKKFLKKPFHPLEAIAGIEELLGVTKDGA
jgi:CheY-like chemotaxis protein